MALVSKAEVIQAAIAGQVVSFPTDTVPALAVRPEQSALIYQLKHRELSKPLILMAATVEALWPYLAASPAEQQIWQKIMSQYWPGALTLVLPASDRLPPAINSRGDQTIGIRIPNQAIALEILQHTGPLATTSANVSGQPPLQTLMAIAQTFPTVMALDCRELETTGPIGNGHPSTVVQWQGGEFRVLRQGQLKIT
jgi:L-threonylcarbamoyladenylate synthase